MSESAKPRFAVDLDDIEKQLAYGQAPAQPAASTRNDPLAELARIVGQDDPFQSMLSTGNTARPQAHSIPNLDDMFPAQERVSAAPRGFEPSDLHAVGAVPAAFDLDQYQPAVTSGRAYAEQGAAVHADAHEAAYDEASYDQNYYAPAAAGPAYAEPEPEEETVRPLKRRGSRKGMIALGVIAGAAVIGAGGAWYATGSSSVASGGKPPLIRASKEPTKVQPENPGGVEIPNQNKQILERAAQPTETKVVNREEQPVDVKQATRVASADATGPVASAQNNSLNLGEPRKVRTVTIRPDGSNQDAAAARPVAAIPPVTMPPGTQPSAAAAAVQPKPAASTPVAPAATTEAPAPAAKPATTIGALAQASASPAAPTPKPAATTPQPQKIAVVAPTTPVPAASEAPVSAGGAYSVQLGFRTSEAAAQAAYRQMQQKYEDLDGLAPLIVKAESNGNTIYRVRTSGMSREEASALCSKLQGQGGQCFVAKN
ncbi:SPOR domain-containing protein [Microvirga sp. 2MCAF38]|uniref:SPOR domain-containing protein n=1 Tax=Microvirga sp. 2MCAF38 TaxID=3232989 RepID=UPI003F95FF79